MSELAKFVKARNINNVINGTIKVVRSDNPFLFDVQMPEGKILTLPAANKLDLSLEDVVQVVMPSGNNRQAFVSDLSAVVLGGDPINKVLAIDTG